MEYEEELVSKISPEGHKLYPRGFHTLSAVGDDLCVVDGKRFLFVPRRLPSVLKSKLQSLFSRIQPS